MMIARTTNIHRRPQLIVTVIGLLSVAYLLVPHLMSERITLSYHGAFHSSIVYSILNNGLPAQNPGFANYVLRSYWPYHTILSIISFGANVPPVISAVGINLIAALGILVFTYRTADGLDSNAGPVAAVVILLLALAPADAYIQSLLGTIPGDVRISTFLAKFLNISGFPLALLLVSALTYMFSKLATEFRIRRAVAFSLLAATLFYIHPTTALFAYIGLVVASGASTIRGSNNPAWGWIAVWGVVAVLTIPFYLYLQSIGTPGASIHFIPAATSPGGILSEYMDNIQSFCRGLILLGPLLAVGTWESIRIDESVTEFGLAVMGWTIITAGVVLFLTGDNQYKSAYIVMIPAAPIASVGARSLWSRLSAMSCPRVLAGVIVLALLVNPFAVLANGYLASEWAENQDYAFSGDDIVLTEQAEYESTVFHYLREDSPPDSVLLVGDNVTQGLGYNAALPTRMIVPALAQRNLYAADYELSEEYLQYRSLHDRRSVERKLLECGSDKIIESGHQGDLFVLIRRESGDSCSLSTEFNASHRWRLASSSNELVLYRYENVNGE